MKEINKKRLNNLEQKSTRPCRYKSALVICDPAIFQTIDASMLEVEVAIVLPDNGRNPCLYEIKNGSYTVSCYC